MFGNENDPEYKAALERARADTDAELAAQRLLEGKGYIVKFLHGNEPQVFYGYFEDTGETPEYDPPHDAPCPFCGKPVVPGDVRLHSLMYSAGSYAKRSYFYRTHRTCAETDPTHTAMDGFILDMIARNGD